MNSVFVEGWRPMGKIYLTLAAIFVAVVHAPAQAPVPARADVERRVDSILSLMTIEDEDRPVWRCQFLQRACYPATWFAVLEEKEKQ